MNYIKGFGVSFIFHSLILACFVIFASNMEKKPPERIVIDLSSVITESAPLIPQGLDNIDELPSPKSREEPKPKPKKVVKTPSSKPVAEESAKPLQAPVEDNVKYVEATEDSATSGQEQAEFSPPADGAETDDTSGDLAEGAGGASQGEADAQKRAGYIASNFGYIQKIIKGNLIYPEKARRRGLRGKVSVRFTINSDGSVSDLCVEASSGHEALDIAGMDAVKASAPFPKPPITAQIVVPISFKIK